MGERIREKVELFQRIVSEVPELVYLGDPVLRTPTQKATIEEAKEISDKLTVALLKMRKIAGYGRGLAAPQIGVGKSVFVTFVDDKFQTFINPEITIHSEENNYYRELCLSSGIMWSDVERPESIEMKWTDLDGDKHLQKFDGFPARLVQHEEAHLRGLCNLDEAVKGTIEILTGNPLEEKLRESRG